MAAGALVVALSAGPSERVHAEPDPGAGSSTSLVSVSATGDPADADIRAVSTSASGRYVAFDTAATNLVPGTTNDAIDVYVHDRETGATERVSVSSSGAEADGVSRLAGGISAVSNSPSVISWDGRFVAFMSDATNLGGAEGRSGSQIYVHDRLLGRTEHVSVMGGLGAPHGATDPAISANGRYVAFSAATTGAFEPPWPDTRGRRSIWVHDRWRSETLWVSQPPTPGQQLQSMDSPALSADGCVVAWQSDETEFHGGTTGHENVFVSDLRSGVIEWASPTEHGGEADDDSRWPALSADGSLVAFTSQASDLVEGSHRGDVYLFDRRDDTVRAAADFSGGRYDQDYGHATFAPVSLSPDGRELVFSTSSRGRPAGSSVIGHRVFLTDLEQPHTDQVSVRADGSDIVNGGALRPSLSADRGSVAFVSNARGLADLDDDPEGTVQAYVRELPGGSQPLPRLGTSDCGALDPPLPGDVERPVIFVHGLMGSHLSYERPLLGTRRHVWPAIGDRLRPTDGTIHVAQLRRDGTSPLFPDREVFVDSDRGIDGALGRVPELPFGRDVYASTFDLLAHQGYSLDETLHAFAYDWRQSVEGNGEELLAFIDAVRAQTGADDVDILAHSLGGLVTAAALEQQASVGMVRNVVTLGTPFLGAPRAYSTLELGEPCIGTVGFICLIREWRAQQLVQNFPGFLATLPSERYFEVASEPPVAVRDGDAVRTLSFAESRRLLQNGGRNMELIGRADAFHARVDEWSPADPDVALLRVVGSGHPTLTQVLADDVGRPVCTVRLVSTARWPRGSADCTQLSDVDIRTGTWGDATVPIHSAAGGDLTADNLRFVSDDHGELPLNPGVIAEAVAMFRELDDEQTAPLRAASEDAVSHDPPEPVDGVQVRVTGRGAGTLRDDVGGRLFDPDPAAGVPSQLSGGSVVRTGASQWFTVTEPGAYRLTWEAEAGGEAHVVVRALEDGDPVEAVTATGLAVAEGDELVLDLDVPAQLGTASLEREGQPVALTAPATGAAAGDRLVPESEVSVERAGGEATVTVTATDPGSAGVERVEYLVGDGWWQTYRGPVVVPADGLMFVRAVDRAGNLEEPQAIRLAEHASVHRASGPDRITTAVALSEAAFDDADVVVLGRADDYADALAGGPLAARRSAPILLTGSAGLHDAAAAEIERLGATQVTLLGGSAALSEAIVDDLVALGIEADEIQRLGGANRFDTARLVAEELGGRDAYLVEGIAPEPHRGWPDGVSVSGIAAHQERPILLTRQGSLPRETAAAFEALAAEGATVVGGAAAVSEEVADAVRALDVEVARVSGADRYLTSRAVAELTVDELGAQPWTWLATGRNWPDSLVAGPAVAAHNGVLLLATGTTLGPSSAVGDWLASRRDDLEAVLLLGGGAAISEDYEAAVAEALR